MTTTTGGAAHIMARLDDYLQTEWPELQVHLTSVTEQWAVASICGPNAPALVAELCDGFDPDPAQFPFMSWREAHIDGVPVRIFRISFTGELSYEINIQASLGAWLWERIFTLGASHGATPYGTDAMHLLRAEKGFIIIGQETDGTVTPQDLRLGRMVKRGDDFIGRRSLTQANMRRRDRKQLVGLLPDDPNLVLMEGAQIIATLDEPRPPVKMLGHVTSSYFSPALRRSFALALIEAGGDRIGEMLYASWKGNPPAPVLLTGTDFLADAGIAPHQAMQSAGKTPRGAMHPGDQTALRRSALGHRDDLSSPDASIKIAERAGAARIIVKGDAAQIGPAIKSSTGLELSEIACTSISGDAGTALWLGPTEWLLLLPEGRAAAYVQSMEGMLSGVHRQIVDMTDHYATIRITGAASREVLAKITTLDMHRRAFAVGAVKGSVFGRVTAWLHLAEILEGEIPCFDLIVRRSHADYLWCLLAAAGREYGLPEQVPLGQVTLARSE